jgi:hypothetical protein
MSRYHQQTEYAPTPEQLGRNLAREQKAYAQATTAPFLHQQKIAALWRQTIRAKRAGLSTASLPAFHAQMGEADRIGYQKALNRLEGLPEDLEFHNKEFPDPNEQEQGRGGQPTQAQAQEEAPPIRGNGPVQKVPRPTDRTAGPTLNPARPEVPAAPTAPAASPDKIVGQKRVAAWMATHPQAPATPASPHPSTTPAAPADPAPQQPPDGLTSLKPRQTGAGLVTSVPSSPGKYSTNTAREVAFTPNAAAVRQSYRKNDPLTGLGNISTGSSNFNVNGERYVDSPLSYRPVGSNATSGIALEHDPTHDASLPWVPKEQLPSGRTAGIAIAPQYRPRGADSVGWGGFTGQSHYVGDGRDRTAEFSAGGASSSYTASGALKPAPGGVLSSVKPGAPMTPIASTSPSRPPSSAGGGSVAPAIAPDLKQYPSAIGPSPTGNAFSGLSTPVPTPKQYSSPAGPSDPLAGLQGPTQSGLPLDMASTAQREQDATRTDADINQKAGFDVRRKKQQADLSAQVSRDQTVQAKRAASLPPSPDDPTNRALARVF